jgi:hypothetical protein
MSTQMCQRSAPLGSNVSAIQNAPTSYFALNFVFLIAMYFSPQPISFSVTLRFSPITAALSIS